MTHILVVDDDAQIRSLLRIRFEKEGFTVTEAGSAAELRTHLQSRRFDLVTLDLTLGRDDGLALAREIRATCPMPIIMISAKDEEVDRIVGLELGADDYITKPFSPREVVARVKAVLRRSGWEGAGAAPLQGSPSGAETASGVNGRRLSFEGGVLDPARREVVGADGTVLELTTAEFNLLELLLRHPQRVLSRDEIMNALKGHDWSAFDRSVDSAVARLRKKIEPDPDHPRFIKTVRGVGYVMAADVRKA